MRKGRTQTENSPNGRLGPIERVPLDALSAQGDEDDEGGRHLFTQNNGCQGRHGQGEVGSDPSFEQSFQGLIQNPGAAENSRQQREPKAERFPIGGPCRVIDHPDEQVHSEQRSDYERQQIEGGRLIVEAAFRLAGAIAQTPPPQAESPGPTRGRSA